MRPFSSSNTWQPQTEQSHRPPHLITLHSSNIFSYLPFSAHLILLLLPCIRGNSNAGQWTSTISLGRTGVPTENSNSPGENVHQPLSSPSSSPTTPNLAPFAFFSPSLLPPIVYLLCLPTLQPHPHLAPFVRHSSPPPLVHQSPLDLCFFPPLCTSSLFPISTQNVNHPFPPHRCCSIRWVSLAVCL